MIGLRLLRRPTMAVASQAVSLAYRSMILAKKIGVGATADAHLASDKDQASRIDGAMILNQGDQLVAGVEHAVLVAVMVDAGARGPLKVVDPPLQILAGGSFQL